ncbi:MAG: hypothetical protein LKI42_00010 [Bacteroidales bacterium]|jgi:polygalacturonase|nr:hypothetical protein [Bacteroidales bacterium]MCI1785645.1 hypothetical protein [Bacteroidales bacterium]
MKKIILFAVLALISIRGFAAEYKASLFGIKSNGVIDNTASIQRAIDFISDKGGGTLVFSVGRYLTGAVILKSNVSITLKEGAVIVGTTNIYGYKGRKAIFNAEGLENITISGKGVIDGRGPDLRADLEKQKSKGYLPEDSEVPSLLFFKNCKNIILRNFIMRNSGTAPSLYLSENSDVKEDGCYTDDK